MRTMEVLGEPQNIICPFTLEEVESLGEDRLTLSNGVKTVAVSGDSFLIFIKNEFDTGKALSDVVIDFESASSSVLSSLELATVDLRLHVSASCRIQGANYAPELLGVIDTHYAMVASYESRLATLDAELLRLLKIFIVDLLDFGRIGDAMHRLESHLETQVFFMSEVYFTSSQMETILAFPGKKGLPLQVVLEAKFKDGKEVCAAHSLARILMIHFNVPKSFKHSKEHRDCYKAFCKAWRRRR